MAESNQPKKKVFTLTMQGFGPLVHALGRVPLNVNRALPLIERGELVRGKDGLTAALIKVELAKAVILGHLAYAAMKDGDVGNVTGYMDIGLQSLTELGLDETEIAKMFKLVLAQLPPDKQEGPATDAGSAQDKTGEKKTD